MSKLKQIKVSFRFSKLLDADLVARSNAICTGMTGNPAYPSPPVDLASFKSAIDSYTASIVDALDGSKKAIVERNKQREALVKVLQLLGRYVEIHCKDDMTTFLSSGFEAASHARTPAQPLPPATILKVDQGNTGQLLLSIKPLARARSYEVRYAPLGTGGTPSAWATATFTSAKKAAPVNSLTPGTTYAFQVRALGRLGYTDWSDSATRMCT
jgi:hypothetical protein